MGSWLGVFAGWEQGGFHSTPLISTPLSRVAAAGGAGGALPGTLGEAASLAKVTLARGRSWGGGGGGGRAAPGLGGLGVLFFFTTPPPPPS